MSIIIAVPDAFQIDAIIERKRIVPNLEDGKIEERHHRPAALTPAWRLIIQESRTLLSRYELWGIKQLIYYLNTQYIEPADITADSFDAFAKTKNKNLAPAQSRTRIRAAVRGWDRVRLEVPELALRAVPYKLLEIRFKNPPFTLYPASFQIELVEFSRHARGGGIPLHLSNYKNIDPQKPSARKSSGPLNALTLKTRLQLIRSAAGAQVRAGRSIESITSISHVVTAEALTILLREIRARQDLTAKDDASRPRQHFSEAKVAIDIAVLARNWCGLDATELKAIGHICRNLRWRRSYDRLFRPVRVTASMRQFENPDAVRRWFELPHQLIASAENARLAGSKISLCLANDVEFAVMSLLLRDSPIRIRTLAGLRISGDRPNITEGDAAFLVIYAVDNKNFKPMKTPLSETAKKALQLYRAHYRPWILKRFGDDPKNPFLFPGQKKGRHRHVATLGASFRRRHKDAGLYFTPHLVRHLLAKLVTESEGASVETVRALLGHKSLDTAHRHYVEDRVDLASQHFRSVAGPAAISPRLIIGPQYQDFRLADVLNFSVTPESLRNLEPIRHLSRNYLKTAATYFARFQDYLRSCGEVVGLGSAERAILAFSQIEMRTHKPSSICNEVRIIANVIALHSAAGFSGLFLQAARLTIDHLVDVCRKRHKSKPTSARRKSTPRPEWPSDIRQAWTAICAPEMAVTSQVPSALQRERIPELYSRYLQFTGANNLASAITPSSIAAFLTAKQAEGLKHSSLFRYAEDLYHFSRFTRPDADLSWFRSLVDARRKQWRKVETLNRFDLVVNPAALLSLGRDVLSEAEKFERLDRNAAILYRDGVLLLFLVCVPLRLRQFQSLRINDLQLIELPGHVICRRETLVGTHHSQFPLWPELRTPLERYLRIYRPLLCGQKSSEALWLSRRGTPLSRGSSAEALVRHTRARFGIGLSTDHIRAIVANAILEESPDRFAYAATMLQLHGIEAFRKYADRAKAILAHQASTRVQDSFEDRH